MKYSELLRAIADGKRLETAYAGDWHPMTEKAAVERMARGDDIEWREALKMARQVACDVPEPMRVMPGVGDEYFLPYPVKEKLATSFRWEDDEVDHRLFVRGICYKTQEDAIARALAMLQIESV